LEKDIRPSVDEKMKSRCIARLPSAADARALIGYVAEFSV